MKKLHYSEEIAAPAHTVWAAMLDDTTYREWTGVFYEGSYYEGNWNLGSEIRFLGPTEEGQPDGMVARVVENRPDERISLEYIGQLVRGKLDTESDQAKRLIGAHENYSFSYDKERGVTSLTVDLDSSEEEYVEMFNDGWPKSLAKLKEIAEAKVAAEARP